MKAVELYESAEEQEIFNTIRTKIQTINVLLKNFDTSVNAVGYEGAVRLVEDHLRDAAPGWYYEFMTTQNIKIAHSMKILEQTRNKLLQKIHSGV